MASAYCRIGAGRHLTSAEILEDARVLDEACQDAKRAALLQFTSVTTAIAARMTDDEAPSTNSTVATPQWSLTIDDMIRMTGQSRRWLFEHKDLPFVRAISRKKLIGDEALLRRWIANRRA